MHTAITSHFHWSHNVPFSLIDSEFHAILNEMDTQYQVPHQNGVSHEISEIYNHLEEKIRSLS